MVSFEHLQFLLFNWDSIGQLSVDTYGRYPTQKPSKTILNSYYNILYSEKKQ